MYQWELDKINHSLLEVPIRVGEICKWLTIEVVIWFDHWNFDKTELMKIYSLFFFSSARLYAVSGFVWTDVKCVYLHVMSSKLNYELWIYNLVYNMHANHNKICNYCLYIVCINLYNYRLTQLDVFVIQSS